MTAPTDALATAAGVVARRLAPPAAARRRGRRAAARVHDPRRGRAAPRRHRRTPPADVVRRAPLAGRAASRCRVVRARSRRDGRRLGARRRRRRARSPSRAGSPAGDVIRMHCSRRAAYSPRPRSPRPPACSSTQPCARLPCTSAALGSPRWTLPPSARSPSSLVGWARGSVDAQQLAGGSGTSAFLLLVPALIVFAVAVLSARLLAPALRALGRAGRRGPISLRLAAASLARNPGPCSNRGDVPRREPRSRAVRGRVSLDAPARAARRGGLRGPGRLRAHRGPVAARAGAARRADPVAAGHADPGAAPVRQHPVGHDLQLPRAARTVARPACRGGARTSRTSRSRHSAASSRRATPDCRCSPSRPAGSSRCRWRQPATTSASARSSARSSATTSRSRSATRARTIASSCTAASRSGMQRSRARARHPEQRPADGEWGHRHPAEREGRAGVRHAARQRDGGARRRSSAGPAPAAWAGARPSVGYVLTPDRTGRFRPRQPTDGLALPVLATPQVAAAAGPRGIIPLDSRGRVGRRPHRRRRQAIPVDRRRCGGGRHRTGGARDSTRVAGLGTTDELWLTSATTSARAAGDACSRSADTLARLQADPLARGALLTLAGTAAVALLLALLGLVLVRRERRA